MTMNVIEQLKEELERVTAEDFEESEYMSDEDIAFNNGWSSGMSRAIAVLLENGVG